MKCFYADIDFSEVMWACHYEELEMGDCRFAVLLLIIYFNYMRRLLENYMREAVNELARYLGKAIETSNELSEAWASMSMTHE